MLIPANAMTSLATRIECNLEPYHPSFKSLTEGTVNHICKNLSAGMPLELALEFADVSHDTFAEWIRAAKNGDKIVENALRMFQKCDEDYINEHVETIRQHAKKDWRAADRLLALKRPSNFAGKGTRIKIEQNNTINMSPAERIMNMSTQVLEQVASGAMNLEDAKIVFAAIEQTRRVAETLQIKERIDLIEQKVKDASTT